MNREFKFRVWDDSMKKFIKYKYISPMSDCGQCVQFHLNDLNSSYYKISQFTGLFDCEQNPIFEGDLVDIKYSYSDKKLTTFVKYKEIENCGCCTGDSGIGFVFIDVKDNFPVVLSDINDIKNYAKIIGNVYSTPELMKKQE